jgi:hypothetical protein
MPTKCRTADQALTAARDDRGERACNTSIDGAAAAMTES